MSVNQAILRNKWQENCAPESSQIGQLLPLFCCFCGAESPELKHHNRYKVGGTALNPECDMIRKKYLLNSSGDEVELKILRQNFFGYYMFIQSKVYQFLAFRPLLCPSPYHQVHPKNKANQKTEQQYF